jgi:hypothetical protein
MRGSFFIKSPDQLFVIVTVTSSVSVPPLLSVTVSLNTYVPATRPESFVELDVGLTIE